MFIYIITMTLFGFYIVISFCIQIFMFIIWVITILICSWCCCCGSWSFFFCIMVTFFFAVFLTSGSGSWREVRENLCSTRRTLMLPQLVQHFSHFEQIEGVRDVWTNIVVPGCCFFFPCLFVRKYVHTMLLGCSCFLWCMSSFFSVTCFWHVLPVSLCITCWFITSLLVGIRVVWTYHHFYFWYSGWLHLFLHCFSCGPSFFFGWKLFFINTTDYFWLTRFLRLSFATGFTADVCNTFINRFAPKGSPYGYRENFFWRSFWPSAVQWRDQGQQNLGGGF